MNGLDLLGASVVGYVEPAHPIVETPGAVLAEMDDVLAEGNTLDRDVTAFKSADPGFGAFRDAWSTFWSGYKKFYEDNKGWTSRLWGSTVEHARDTGRALNDWRAKFTQFPGAVATQPAPTKVQQRDDPSAFPWSKVAIGGVAVAGVFAGGYALSKLGVFGAIFGARRRA